MKNARFSTRQKLFFTIIIANVLILSVAVIRLYRTWQGHGDPEIILIVVFLLMAAFVLNIYFWLLILHKVFRPLDSIINSLYIAANISPPNLEKPGSSPDEIGKLTHVLRVFHENTRQTEEAAKELKTQTDYLQSILETIPEAIITINPAGQIQMVNAAVEKMFGFNKEELIGQKINVVLPPLSGENGREIGYFGSSAANLKKLREHVVRRKDGATFPIELWISELHHDSHRIFLSVIRDVSARKKYEEERENHMRDLERSNGALDDFAYIVSHDLKEPLRGLQSFTHFLLEDYEAKLDADGQNKLRTISDLARRLEQRLDTLLYFSRVGRTALAVHETDLNAVVQGVINTMRINLKEKNTAIEVVVKLPAVVCDHVRIAEVFQNLICNAIKYNDKAENRIEIGCMTNHPRKPGENVFYVQDHGIGISEKHLESVFKIFKRLHSQDAYGGGTGSGLAIARKIINQHGGEIWAESKGEGAGATFFFTIASAKEMNL